MRTLISCIVALLVLFPIGAIAQEATPASKGVATPALSSDLLDLPAMCLTPQELADLGLGGFSLDVARLATGPEAAALTGSFVDDPDNPTSLTDVLSARGLVGAFTLWLDRPATVMGTPESHSASPTSDAPATPVTPAEISQEIHCFLDQYQDPAGSEAAFDAMERGQDEYVPGTRTIADESVFLRDERNDRRVGPMASLSLYFRLGAIHAGIILKDTDGTPPDVTTLETLGEAFRAKIERLQREGSAGLSTKALSVAGVSPVPVFGNYVRLNGEPIPYWAVTTEEQPALQARLGDAIDVYTSYQSLGEGSYVSTLYRFASAEEAAAWVDSGAERAATLPGFAGAEPVSTSTAIGDTSVTLALTGDGVPDGQVQAHIVYANVGSLAFGTGIVGVPGITAEVVEGLAEAQAACLREAGPCPPVPVPPELPALVTPAP